MRLNHIQEHVIERLPLRYICEIAAIMGFIGLLLVLATSALDFSKMWVFADLLPFPNELDQRVDEFFYIWSDDGLGSLITPMHSIVRFALFLQILVPNAILAQKVALFLPFFVAAFSIYFVSTRLKFSFLTKLVSSTVFIINPFFLSMFIVGNIGVLMTIAIFPFLFYFFYGYLKGGRYTCALISGILYFLFIWNLYYFVWLFAGGIALFGIKNATKLISKDGIISFLIRFGKISALLILLSLPSIVILSVETLSGSQSTVKENVISEVSKNYQDGDISNVLRLAGNRGSPQVAGYLSYNQFNNYTLWGLILAVIPISGILLANERHLQKNLYISFLLFLLAVTLIIMVKSFPEISIASSVFYTLRNPSKLFALVHFFYIFAFMYAAESIYRSRFGPRIKIKFSYIALPLVIVAILFYSTPFLDGSLAVLRMQGTYYIKHPYFIADEYYELPEILNNLSGSQDRNSYEVLYLPQDRFSHHTLSRIDPNYFGIGTGLAGFRSMDDLYSLYMGISRSSNNIEKVLAEYNVKYIVIDKSNVARKYDQITVYKDNLNSVWLTGGYDTLSSVFSRNFERVYEDNNFIIFVNPALSEPNLLFLCNANDKSYTTARQIVLANTTNLYEIGSLANTKIVGRYTLSVDDILTLHGDMFNQWPNMYTIIAPIDKNNLEIKLDVRGDNVTNAHAKLLWYSFVPTDYNGDSQALKKEIISFASDEFKQGKWVTVQESFVPPADAKAAIFFVLGSQVKTEGVTTSTSIKNLIISKEQSYTTTLCVEPVTTQYAKISPTLWEANVDYAGSFTLLFSKSYDRFWEAEVYQNNSLVEKVRSVSANGINSFPISTSGNDLHILIKYTPQLWFEISLMLSSLVFAICLFFLWRSFARKCELLHD